MLWVCFLLIWVQKTKEIHMLSFFHSYFFFSHTCCKCMTRVPLVLVLYWAILELSYLSVNFFPCILNSHSYKYPQTIFLQSIILTNHCCEEVKGIRKMADHNDIRFQAGQAIGQAQVSVIFIFSKHMMFTVSINVIVYACMMWGLFDCWRSRRMI